MSNYTMDNSVNFDELHDIIIFIVVVRLVKEEDKYMLVISNQTNSYNCQLVIKKNRTDVMTIELDDTNETVLRNIVPEVRYQFIPCRDHTVVNNSFYVMIINDKLQVYYNWTDESSVVNTGDRGYDKEQYNSLNENGMTMFAYYELRMTNCYSGGFKILRE